TCGVVTASSSGATKTEQRSPTPPTILPAQPPSSTRCSPPDSPPRPRTAPPPEDQALPGLRSRTLRRSTPAFRDGRGKTVKGCPRRARMVCDKREHQETALSGVNGSRQRTDPVESSSLGADQPRTWGRIALRRVPGAQTSRAVRGRQPGKDRVELGPLRI